jgi:hypothetical protein
MKREWVSVAGVPGALVGMFIAMLLFASAVGFQHSEDAMAINFVFMTVFYLWYAQRTQYSAEEQKKFTKAYTLNANKKNRKRHESVDEDVGVVVRAGVSGVRVVGVGVGVADSRAVALASVVAGVGGIEVGGRDIGGDVDVARVDGGWRRVGGVGAVERGSRSDIGHGSGGGRGGRRRVVGEK